MKIFKTGNVRPILHSWFKGEMTIGRAAEMLNEIAINYISERGGELSDGYHTFNELYEFRKQYNAALFNEWAKEEVELPDGCIEYRNTKYEVHKSWRHHDGELCFGGGWFIVVAVLPGGQISNHYKEEDWDLFKIPAAEKAKYPFDSHTGKDVLERIKDLNEQY